jgi:hypothetical protein
MTNPLLRTRRIGLATTIHAQATIGSTQAATAAAAAAATSMMTVIIAAADTSRLAIVPPILIAITHLADPTAADTRGAALML